MTKQTVRSLRERVALRLRLSADDRVFGVAWRHTGGDNDELSWEGASTGQKREIEDEIVNGCELFFADYYEMRAIESEGEESSGAQSRHGRMPSPPATTVSSPPDWPFYVTPSEAENERARGISAYYAALAREEPDVTRFRKEILGNVLLPPDAVGQWATSIAAQYVLPADYAYLRGFQSPTDHPLVEIVQTTPGAQPLESVVRLRDRGTGEMMTMHRMPPEGFTSYSVGLAGETIEVYKGTTLHCLSRYGDELSRRYGWGQEWAMWFILTGIAPPIHPLEASQEFKLLGGPGRPETTHRQVVTLTLEPWVSEHTLVEAYRRLRYDLRGEQGRTSLKTLTLFCFIMEREGVRSLAKAATRRDAVQWTARMHEWNDLHRESHPDWLYTNHSNFRNAYRDVAENVTGNTRIPVVGIQRMRAIAKAQQDYHARNPTSPYHIPNDGGNGRADSQSDSQDK